MSETEGGSSNPPTSTQPAAVELTLSTTPIRTSHDGQVIENLELHVASGDAITVTNDNVIIRNCVIYHQSGDGISLFGASNVTIENCEIINSSPPTGNRPETSADIININAYNSPNLTVDHVTLRDGSSGMYLLESPGTTISNVEGYNFHGPMPRGQFVQFDKSGDSSLTNFYVYNDPAHSYTEDNISVYNSPNVTVSNGLIDGNNSPSGVGVMFEGNSGGGLVSHVDAVHMGDGAFSSYSKDVTFDYTRSFDNIATDQGRGLPLSNALIWNVSNAGISIEHSTYTHPGNPSNIVWDDDKAVLADVHQDPNATPMQHPVTNSGGTFVPNNQIVDNEITGTSANDIVDATHTISGQPAPTDAVDMVYGMAGNDTLRALGGDDQIYGGDGTDTLSGGAGADTIDGGAGTDTASYAASSSGVAVSLMTGTASGGDAEGDTLTNIENLTGSNFDDTLEGAAGNNKLVGGLGTDTVSYAHAASGDNGLGVTVNLASIKSQNTVVAGKDTLSGFENLIGSEFNDTLSGSSGDNVLAELGGDDRLDGKAGADSLFGGAGDDTYVVDNAGDVVDETNGDGTDTVLSSISFSLVDPVHAVGAIENLTLTGKGAISATGNDLDNILIGNSGANVLMGLDGADTLNGGTGADTMFGGTGDDSYVVDNKGDVVNEIDGDGTDTVLSSVSFSLADPVHAIGSIENLTLTGKGAISATGNDLDNVLIGNSGANVLIGGAGADTMDGGGGVDTASYATSAVGVAVSLVTGIGSGGDAEGDTLTNIEKLTGSNVDDTLEGDVGNNTLVGGLGIDTVSYAHAASGANGLGVTVNLASTKSQNTVVAGKDTLSGFENLTGSEFNDTLRGSSGNNIITGLAGNDKLTGAGGDDTFVFLPGFGNDTITDFTAGPNSGPHDLITFDQGTFADFDAIMASSAQVGSDTVITVDANNTVTLLNLHISSLHQDDFAFV